MFNGYNDTPLISYNEFDQERGKKQDNASKWAYEQSVGVQPQPPGHNRQTEYWSPKSNFLGIPTPFNGTAKCDCSGCYPSDSSIYQNDSSRHRPWLPRTFPVSISGANESYKSLENRQWDGTNFCNQESGFNEKNVLLSQYLQDGKGKPPYYRPCQNTNKSSGYDQPGVITSVKTPNFPKKDILLKQSNDISLNSATQEMPFYGQSGVRQPMFYNPTYGLTRNFEKRLDGKNCDSNYCDFTEKYSNLDPYKHPGSVTSYPMGQHISRSPVVEPYLKAVPLNLNQNRVPSTGHRRLKENIPQPSIDESRKIPGSEGCQTIPIEKNNRTVIQSTPVKESVVPENYQPNQFIGFPPSVGIDSKNADMHIDYSYYSVNRDLNLTEGEAQKLLLDRERSLDYFARNNMSEIIKRNNQPSMQDSKKDCTLNSLVQPNFYDQQYNNLARLSQMPSMPRYLEMSNSKPSSVYSKELISEKSSKPYVRDHLLENANGSQRNENLNAHPPLPPSNIIFNNSKDLYFSDKQKNLYYNQNTSANYRTFNRPENPYQGYVSNRYELFHPMGVNDFQRTDTAQFNQRNVPGKTPNCMVPNHPSLPSQSNSFSFDSYYQQPQNPSKTLPQQLYPEQMNANILFSSLSQNRSEVLPTNNCLEPKKPSYLETIQSQDINKNGANKISPLRLLRKKKLNNQKNDVVNKSPVPTGISEVPASLDVRKFWSTWADEEEDNSDSTQMVVLDCQNIDPAQAHLFHFYEENSVPALHLENGNVVTVKSSDSTGTINRSDEGAKKIKTNCEFNLQSEASKSELTVTKEIRENEKKEEGKLVESEKSFDLIESLPNAFFETNCKEKSDLPFDKSDLLESTSQENIDGTITSGNEIMSYNNLNTNEITESSIHKEDELYQKLKGVENNKSEENKINFKESDQNSINNEILENGIKNESLSKTKNLISSENVLEESKQNGVFLSDEKNISAAKLDFNHVKEKNLLLTLSQNDENCLSGPPCLDKADLPILPTSEYRRNKFLDYSDRKIIINKDNDSVNSLGEKIIQTSENNKATQKVIESNVSRINDDLLESKVEEIKERSIKQDNFFKNGQSLLDKSSNGELGKTEFQSCKSESVINNVFKLKEKTCLQNFEIDDILQKMSKINFNNTGVKVQADSKNICENGKFKKVKGKSSDLKKNKLKHLESKQKNGKRPDALSMENISISKPTINFSIQKSHDLKISLKVLNGSSVNSKRENDDDDDNYDEGDATNEKLEVDRTSANETKKSNELITLKLKGIGKNDWNCSETILNNKFHASDKGKKHKRKFKRKKRHKNDLSFSDTSGSRVKKNKYGVKREDFLDKSNVHENTVGDSLQKECHSVLNDFKIQESGDSAKMKLTFRRLKGNSIAKSKSNTNGDINLQDELEPEEKFSSSLNLESSPNTELVKSVRYHKEISAGDSEFEDVSKKIESLFLPEDSLTSFSSEFFTNKQKDDSSQEKITLSPNYASSCQFVLPLSPIDSCEENNVKYSEEILSSEKVKTNTERIPNSLNGVSDFDVSESLISEVFKESKLNVGKFIKKGNTQNERVQEEVKLIVKEFDNCDEDCPPSGKNYDLSLDNDFEELVENEALHNFSVEGLELKDPLNDSFEIEKTEKDTGFFKGRSLSENKCHTPLESDTVNQLSISSEDSIKLNGGEKKNEIKQFDFSKKKVNSLINNEKDSSECQGKINNLGEFLSNSEESNKTYDLERFSQSSCLDICLEKNEKCTKSETFSIAKEAKSLNLLNNYNEIYPSNASSKKDNSQEINLSNHDKVDIATNNIDVSQEKFFPPEIDKKENELFNKSVFGCEENFSSIEKILSGDAPEQEVGCSKIQVTDKGDSFNLNLGANRENEQTKSNKVTNCISGTEAKTDEISKALESIFREDVNEKEEEIKAEESLKVNLKSAKDESSEEKVFLVSPMFESIRFEKNEILTKNESQTICELSNILAGDDLKDSKNDDSPSKSHINILEENFSVTETFKAKNEDKSIALSSEKFSDKTELCFASETKQNAKEEKPVSELEDYNPKTPLNENEVSTNLSLKMNSENEKKILNEVFQDLVVSPKAKSTFAFNVKSNNSLPCKKENCFEVVGLSKSHLSDKVYQKILNNNFKNSKVKKLSTSALKCIITNRPTKIQRRYSTESKIQNALFHCHDFDLKQLTKCGKKISDTQKKFCKAKSCPPVEFLYPLQIPVLNIPVKDIPLPPGDPPSENCFYIPESCKDPKVTAEILFESNCYALELKSLKKPKNHIPINLSSPEKSCAQEISKSKDCRKKIKNKSQELILKQDSLENSNLANKSLASFTGCSFESQLNFVETQMENFKDKPFNNIKKCNEKQKKVLEEKCCAELVLSEESKKKEGNLPSNQELKTVITEHLLLNCADNLNNESSKNEEVISHDNEVICEKTTSKKPHQIKTDKIDFSDAIVLDEIETCRKTDNELQKSEKNENQFNNENQFENSNIIFKGATEKSENPIFQLDGGNVNSTYEENEQDSLYENLNIDGGGGNEPVPVEAVYDDTVCETNFNCHNFLKDGFYECEDIPTSEDLPVGSKIDEEKVSDDDKFRNIMQNCLDNAKKFLNVSNLKLFSCSVEDLLELDCELTDLPSKEKESDKLLSDSVNHISRDVLLTSCEEMICDDIELSEKFKPSDFSMDFVTFEANASGNLCPEILPVENWPYLEEEVPSSPGKSNSEETELIPFVENSVNTALLSETPSSAKLEVNKILPSEFHKNRSECIDGKNFKRFRRRSLISDSKLTASEIYSKVNKKRRKTIDCLMENCSPYQHHQPIEKVVNDIKTEIKKFKNGLEKIEYLWKNNKGFKCKLDLEKLECCNIQKNLYNIKIDQLSRSKYQSQSECKEESTNANNGFTSSRTLKLSKLNEDLKKNDSTEEKSLLSLANYKSPLWQPKVILFRISKNELKKLKERNLLMISSSRNYKKNNHLEKVKEKEETSQSNSKESKPLGSTPSLMTKRSKVLTEFEKEELEKCVPEKKSKPHVKSDVNVCCNIKNKKERNHRSIKEEKKSILSQKNKVHNGDLNANEKLNTNKKSFKLASYKKSELEKRKKSRFRNLHTKKKIKINNLTKDIISTAHEEILPPKPTLVDPERVLNEIFKDRDPSKEQVFKCLKPNTKELSNVVECKDVDIKVKHKSQNVQVNDLNYSHKRTKSFCASNYISNDESHIQQQKNHNPNDFSSSSFHEKLNKVNKKICKTSCDVTKSQKSDLKIKTVSQIRPKEKSDLKERHTKSYRHQKESRSSESNKGREDTAKHKDSSSSNGNGDISSEKKVLNSEKTRKSHFDVFLTKKDEKNLLCQEKSKFFKRSNDTIEEPWICEVCGFADVTERVVHIKNHPFHCQSCHLAFKTEARFINHLTEKHKDIRNQHHCLLCELSFDTEEQYQQHLETREHKHLETVEKNTINTLFTLLTGQPCPVLGLVEMKPEWLPSQAGTVHFYHQATPLSLALQYLKMHHDLSLRSLDSSSHHS